MQDHQALREWLSSKIMHQSDLRNIGKYYQSKNPDEFAQNLTLGSGIFPKTKLKDLTQTQFEQLISSIEKLCQFFQTGKEEFYLQPKIVGKIECVGQAPLYLIGTHIALTHSETWPMDRITSFR